MKSLKIKFLFDIRDLTVALFISSLIFWFGSYMLKEIRTTEFFGTAIIISFVVAFVLNIFCNISKQKIRTNRRKNLFKNNTIDNVIYLEDKKIINL